MTTKEYLNEMLRQKQELLEEMGRMAELLTRVISEVEAELDRRQELQSRILRLISTDIR